MAGLYPCCPTIVETLASRANPVNYLVLILQLLLIRYTLDLMHCEMNLTKNFLKTITAKKDTVKVRRDLQRKDIRKHLWLTPHPRRAGKMVKPRVSYVLSNEEFEKFAKCIES